MPTSRHTQTSLASGEFDPLLWGREDVSFFYTSCRLAENVTLLPQGAATRREGWRKRNIQRGVLSAVSLSGVTETAPNGGTATNAFDGDSETLLLTTTDISTTATYVVLHMDFGSAIEFSALDVEGLHFSALPGGTEAETVALQYSDDDAAWTTAATVEVGTVAYRRRFALEPDVSLGDHRYWRLAVLNTGDLTTAKAELAEVTAWLEAGYSTASTSPGNYNVARLTAAIGSEYCIVLTANNADVYDFSTGAWLAAVYIPHTDAQVEDIKTSTKLDTMVLYQEDVHPFNVQRLTSTGTEWQGENFPFYDVVEFPFGDENVSGGQNETQFINFSGINSGNRFLFELAGEVSAEIAFDGTAATNATNMEAALEGMANITSVSVTVDDGSAQQYQIEFDGIDAKRPWPILIIEILNGNGEVEITRTQSGRADFDDLWSATRGYPSCGAFYQGRHYMGGFKSRKDVIAISRSGTIAEFKEDLSAVAASPIVAAPDLDDDVDIIDIYPGRHLQIFTSSAELYIPDEPVTPDNIALKASTSYGSQSKTQPVDIQGGTLFFDHNGQALREFLFTDAQQNYTAEPVSLLAGHLVASPSSFTLRRSTSKTKPALLCFTNTGRDEEGELVPAVMVSIDRAQSVTGFSRVKTQGTPLAFSASLSGQTMALVSRELGGNAWNYLEQFDEDFMSDCAVEISNTDFDDFTATASQTVFTYTFTSPVLASGIAVWTRSAATAEWSLIGEAEYTVDLGAKTVTFDTGLSVGTLVHINLRQDTVALGDEAAFFNGVECYVHCDGRPAGNLTPAAGSIDLGLNRFDFTAQVGLRFVPKITLHPYKGRGDLSPTMDNMRIFRALLNLSRTGAVSITASNGGTLRPVPLANYDSGTMDPTLNELLFTGLKRVSGLGRWQKEPTLTVSQIDPMPFTVKVSTYDVRF